MNDIELQLRKLIGINSTDEKAAANAFHRLYEIPVLGSDDLYEGLIKLPRPYRELAAAHQAWGIVASDGFENYLEDTDARFDTEVEAGLKLTGHGECYAAIPEARRLLEAGALTRDDDDRLWSLFYDPIEFFPETVGAFLLRYLNKG